MEPMDLCVRPFLCIVCKRRFWTTVELQQHFMLSHEIVQANISHPRFAGTSRNSSSSSGPFTSGQSLQNTSVSYRPGSSRVLDTSTVMQKRGYSEDNQANAGKKRRLRYETET